MKKKMLIINIILIITIIILNINSAYANTGQTHGGSGRRRDSEDTSLDSEDTSLGGIINGAQGFIEAGKTEKAQITQENLQTLSNMIYNILLVVGIIIAVILGAILGIKFITEGVEGQIEVKKALVPYVVGCVVVFGAFAIWKIVVEILQSM